MLDFSIFCLLAPQGLNTALMVAAGRDKAEAVQALLGMEGLNLEVQNKVTRMIDALSGRYAS